MLDGFSAFGRIRRVIKHKYGNQRNCAQRLGISQSHLSDMLNGRCELSPLLLQACGLQRRVMYQVISDELGDEDEVPPKRLDAYTSNFLRGYSS